jgi:hypothetical protein
MFRNGDVDDLDVCDMDYIKDLISDVEQCQYRFKDQEKKLSNYYKKQLIMLQFVADLIFEIKFNIEHYPQEEVDKMGDFIPLDYYNKIIKDRKTRDYVIKHLLQNNPPMG